MRNGHTPDRARQAHAAGGLLTCLPGYPDTRIAWIPPRLAVAHMANTAWFVVEGEEPFPFQWSIAILGVKDIDSATVRIVARADRGRNVAEIALHATNGLGLIPLADAERLIERYTALVGGVEAGTPFPIGHRPPKVTARTAANHAATIRGAYRDCVDECGDPNPSQHHLVTCQGGVIGFHSNRGFELYLKRLKKYHYVWPDSYR